MSITRAHPLSPWSIHAASALRPRQCWCPRYSTSANPHLHSIAHEPPAPETGAKGASARHTRVAGSFLFKFPGGDTSQTPQVALFKRAPSVRFGNKWGLISGVIESDDATPYDAALRELREETSLGMESLTLFREGRPYCFQSKTGHSWWTVFPFGFILDPKHESRIKTLPEEHLQYRWFDRNSPLDSQEYVLNLDKSLRRVWFERWLDGATSSILLGAISELQGAALDGSQRVSLALNAVMDVLKALSIAPLRQGWWDAVQLVLWHLWKTGCGGRDDKVLAAMNAAFYIVDRHRGEADFGPPHVEAIIKELGECCKAAEGGSSA